MELSTSKVFPAELSELSNMIEWARGYLIQLGCDPLLVKKIELALEEALVNVITHAYGDKGGPVEIGIIGKAKSHFEITISDKGPKFNPVEEAPPFDADLPLEDRKEGGVGVHLIKQIVDEIHYRREKDKNVLILKKKF